MPPTEKPFASITALADRAAGTYNTQAPRPPPPAPRPAASIDYLGDAINELVEAQSASETQITRLLGALGIEIPAPNLAEEGYIEPGDVIAATASRIYVIEADQGRDDGAPRRHPHPTGRLDARAPMDPRNPARSARGIRPRGDPSPALRPVRPFECDCRPLVVTQDEVHGPFEVRLQGRLDLFYAPQ